MGRNPKATTLSITGVGNWRISPEAKLALAPQNSKQILSRLPQRYREHPCQRPLPSLGPKFSRPAVVLEKEKEEWLCKEGPVIDFPHQYLLPLSNLIWDNGFPCFRDQTISYILQNACQPLYMLKYHI